MIRESAGMRVAVTGAAGFIGSVVVDRIARGALGKISTLRLNDIQQFEYDGASIIAGSYADSSVRERLLEGGIDILFHLASIPGGASERDPALGRSTNLDGSIALIDAAAQSSKPVVVYTSSIAVFGPNTDTITDLTPLQPSGSYGTHKAMIELYMADLTRRGLINARTVRPAGIVARPSDAYSGFATAWMSDLFHAATEYRAIAVPASPSTQIWLQSIDTLADNIIHAALMPETVLPPHRAWTLPATALQIEMLAASLSRHTDNTLQIEYQGGARSLPPLDASAALALGFLSDGDVDALVGTVLNRIKQA